MEYWPRYSISKSYTLRKVILAGVSLSSPKENEVKHWHWRELESHWQIAFNGQTARKTWWICHWIENTNPYDRRKIWEWFATTWSHCILFGMSVVRRTGSIMWFVYRGMSFLPRWASYKRGSIRAYSSPHGALTGMRISYSHKMIKSVASLSLPQNDVVNAERCLNVSQCHSIFWRIRLAAHWFTDWHSL